MAIEEEIRELERRFAEAPESRLFLPLADALRRSGELDRAAQICRRGLDSFPEFTSAGVLLGQCLADLGQTVEAREVLERVLLEDPRNFEALKGLGRIAAQEGEGEKASEYFVSAREIEPLDEEVAQAVEALEYGAKEGFDSAEPEESGGSGEVFITHTLGDIYRLQGHYRQAFEVYSRLLEDSPADKVLAAKLEAVARELEPTTVDSGPGATQAAADTPSPAGGESTAEETGTVEKRIDDIFSAVLTQPESTESTEKAVGPDSFVNMFERWIKGLRLLEAK